MPTDIWNYADGFHYLYQSAIGDVSVFMRVDSFTATNITAWPKGGLMLRNSLDANSKHFSLFLTGSEGLSNQWRLQDRGISSAHTNNSLPNSNIWLKITKIGNVFQTYYGTNPDYWIPFGANRTLEFSDHFYYGIAVTSRDIRNEVTLSGSLSSTGFSTSMSPSSSPSSLLPSTSLPPFSTSMSPSSSPSSLLPSTSLTPSGIL